MLTEKILFSNKKIFRVSSSLSLPQSTVGKQSFLSINSLITHRQYRRPFSHDYEEARQKIINGRRSAYHQQYKHSLERSEEYWYHRANRIEWMQPWTKIYEQSEDGDKWFLNGHTNITHNCLDRHCENGQGDRIAVYFDSAVANIQSSYSYNDVKRIVSYIAGAMKRRYKLKPNKDVVMIYMPNIPQTLFTMLACARIGIPHCVVFGGFPGPELAKRIQHVRPKLIVTTNVAVEKNRLIDYPSIVLNALKIANEGENSVNESEIKLLISNRSDFPSCSNLRFEPLEELCEHYEPHDAVPVESNHPLYLLHTSGTTGEPKATRRNHGVHAVILADTIRSVYGIQPGETWWAASDLGWVVSHSYTCYAPLLNGSATVLFEGKPIGTPNASAYFRIISDYRVVSMFTAPTALRAIRKADPSGKYSSKYFAKMDQFRSMFIAGEHCDPKTMNWIKNLFKKNRSSANSVGFYDHWWQTEMGSPITGTSVGLYQSSHLPIEVPNSSAGKPVPGWNVKILDDNGEECAANVTGNIVVKLPLPPGSFVGLWKNKDLTNKVYFNKFPGYYDTSDTGYMDKDKNVFIMSRTDDVINVSGHRLSCGAIEEVIMECEAISDCAVVGWSNSLKGQIPLAFVVENPFYYKKGGDNEKISQQIIEHVTHKLGAVTCLKKIIYITTLPRTRSGKIPRKSLMQMINNENYQIPSTIEDMSVYEEIRE
ncbi:hypothetical protein SNEBB_010534, partial [Seison nebaliae]